MRESNFNLPAQNRACVCISQALYDRRAIDAPAPSLPLVNSLTHLSYLTATSPRIREILSVDGGLERLVRILKACASTSSGQAIDENLAQLKGKGTNLAKGARKSPFKSFSEYTPTIDHDLDLLASSVDAVPRPLALALPSPSPTSSKSKQLLFTYTLAFQCVVNIGVRGSETIRTRVVEAGALDVVVNVLERYLEESARRKKKAESKKMIAIAAPAQIELDAGGPRVEVLLSLPLTQPSLARLEATSSRTVSASSSAASLLAPPARVSTPDTVVSSMDEGDNGSSSGQEGDEVVVLEVETQGERRVRSESKAQAQVDRDGDVVMDGEGAASSTDVDETTAPAAPTRQRSTSRRHHHHRLHQDLAPQPSTPPPMTSQSNEPASTIEEGGLQYRDEDVLLSLQLLAYLSKYPHVRSVFHSPAEMHEEDEDDCSHSLSHGGKASSCAPSSSSSTTSKHPTSTPTLSSNVFSLVEAFTHRPPTSDSSTPRHSNEVQYWAGVIMRNACRKDESRGGIRQCANMQCGVWEKYAREFAKCRRCRKAKYCSKGCQSSAWGKGHRYWCAKAAPKDVGVVEGGDGEGRERERSRRSGEEEEEDEEEGLLGSMTTTTTTTSLTGQNPHVHLPLDGTHTPTDLAPPPPPHRLRGLTPHRVNAGIPPLHVPGAGMNVPGGPRINVEGFGQVDLLGAGGGGMGMGMGMGMGGLDEMAAAREMMGGGVVFGVGEEGV